MRNRSHASVGLQSLNKVKIEFGEIVEIELFCKDCRSYTKPKCKIKKGFVSRRGYCDDWKK